MLSIGRMSGGQGHYYANLASENYYLKGGEPPGQWHGPGAEILGLVGTAKNKQFLEIFSGFKDKAPLVQSAGKKDHRPGWDLAFSPPKTVSVLLSQANEEVGGEVRSSHNEAVKAGLDYLEKNALWTRRGRWGRILERCGGVFCTFEHRTSRANDPQLHTHALLLNLGVRDDGSVGTIETRDIYRHKMVAGAMYRAELAFQLQKRLGLELERKESWFEIKGVSQELAKEFSKRRAEIEALLASRRLYGAKASEISAYETREKKEIVPFEELHKNWREKGAELGWSEKHVNQLIGKRSINQKAEHELRMAGEATIEKLLARNSHFSRSQLICSLADASQSNPIGAAAVGRLAESLLSESNNLIPLGVRLNQPVFTSKEMLGLEKSLLEQVERAKNAAWFSVHHEVIKFVMGSFSLSPEQSKALKVLTDGTAISVLEGIAGTGKTKLLSAARVAWEKAGYQVLGAATAGSSVLALQSEAGIKSASVFQTLNDFKKLPFSVVENRKPFWRAPMWSPLSKISVPRIRPRIRERIRLTEKTVLVIDDANTVGTRQMHAIVSAVLKAGAKLVLVGDSSQLEPMSGGATFAEILKRVPAAKLKEILRQEEGWKKETIQNLANGNPHSVLESFAQRGLVNISSSRPEAINNLLSAWKKRGAEKPEQNLIVGSNNEDVELLNNEAQKLRRQDGFLKGPKCRIKKTNFYAGDRIFFTKTSRGLGVTNGMPGSVKSFDRFRGKLCVLTDEGRELSFSLKNYAHLKLGYALPTHQAQGMTMENIFILTSETMQNRQFSYLQASRARETTRFFTTHAECGENLTELSRRMEQAFHKELAVNVLKPVRHSMNLFH